SSCLFICKLSIFVRRFPLVSAFSYCTSFLFLSFRGHRDRHSFPTRRSSDLCLPPPSSVLTPPAMPAPACCRSTPHPGSMPPPGADRKSTRLNSSHVSISYAVFCLKKKNFTNSITIKYSYDDIIVY